jgi:CRP-like cAMP-binding protein
VDARVFTSLWDQLEPVPLMRGGTLLPSRMPTDHSYFIESGVISLVASTAEGHSIELAVVGREGVAGIADALGHQPLPYELAVQLSGLAYRAPRDLIREHLLSCSALHEILMDYSQRFMHQLAHMAVCNRFHTSTQRLAKWLLLTADRADSPQLEITHDAIAQMLGVPRSMVSQSASALRRQGLITSRPGVLTIRDAARLRTVACECYAAVSSTFPPKSPAQGEPAGTARVRRGRSRP